MLRSGMSVGSSSPAGSRSAALTSSPRPHPPPDPQINALADVKDELLDDVSGRDSPRSRSVKRLTRPGTMRGTSSSRKTRARGPRITQPIRGRSCGNRTVAPTSKWSRSASAISRSQPSSGACSLYGVLFDWNASLADIPPDASGTDLAELFVEVATPIQHPARPAHIRSSPAAHTSGCTHIYGYALGYQKYRFSSTPPEVTPRHKFQLR